MRLWKAVTFLLILAIAGACSNSPDIENKSAEGEAAAAGEPAAGAPAASGAPEADKPKAEAAKPKPLVIPAGTSLSVTLSTSLDSGKNKAGDTFTGNLAEAVIVDGKTALDKGTAMEGKVVSAEGAGKVKGVGKMSLTLIGATVGGKTIAIVTKTHSAEAETSKGKDAAIIGGGAGVGAAIGAIAGGKKGAAVGAAVGGAGGTTAVLATKGKDVEYPAEARLDFTLDQDITLAR